MAPRTTHRNIISIHLRSTHRAGRVDGGRCLVETGSSVKSVVFGAPVSTTSVSMSTTFSRSPTAGVTHPRTSRRCALAVTRTNTPGTRVSDSALARTSGACVGRGPSHLAATPGSPWKDRRRRDDARQSQPLSLGTLADSVYVTPKGP
jgi:hypothetical protein